MKSKKALAARILKTSPSKVTIASDAVADVAKAITRSDIRGFIAVGKIKKNKSNHQSRANARKTAAQKRKGRQKGQGSKKGSKHSVVSRKEKWMAKIRVQRQFLKELRDKKLLSTAQYRELYARSKGGFFRSKRHIKLYITEHRLINTEAK